MPAEGDVQHFFLTGKKATGKTSLVEFVKQYLADRGNALGIYVSNKGNYSLETLVVSIWSIPEQCGGRIFRKKF